MLVACAALFVELILDVRNCGHTCSVDLSSSRQCLAPNVSLTLIPKELECVDVVKCVHWQHFHRFLSKKKLLKPHHVPDVYRYGHLDGSTRLKETWRSSHPPRFAGDTMLARLRTSPCAGNFHRHYPGSRPD
jgi:hypothetical protein